MGAELVYEPDPASRIPECHEVFPEQLDTHRGRVRGRDF